MSRFLRAFMLSVIHFALLPKVNGTSTISITHQPVAQAKAMPYIPIRGAKMQVVTTRRLVWISVPSKVIGMLPMPR